MLRKLAIRCVPFVFVLPALCGCSPTIAYPRLAGPGTAPMQRARSEVYDPYPSADGGPKIVGGRPIDFVQPRDEVTVSRQYDNEKRANLLSARAAAPAVPPGTVIQPGVVQPGVTYAPVASAPPQPVVGPAIPGTQPYQGYPAYPSYPASPTVPVASPALPSSQPPVQYRY